MIEVLTAIPGAAWEGALVASLDRDVDDVTVVRRCVDLADLLATAAAGTGRAVMLSADLRRLDRDALTRLEVAGVAVVGLVTPGDVAGEQRLRTLGVAVVVSAQAPGDVLSSAVHEAVDHANRAGSRPAALAYSEPLRSLPAPADGGVELGPPPARAGTGRLVAVWGPVGSPGRSTVAVTVASEIARLGRPALLADVDSYGSCVAQLLGLLDEAPGLAAATRLAGGGSLDLQALARVAPVVQPGLRVLTGVARADRWTELRPAALERVWEVARSLAGVVVADCSASLEQDEELSFDTAAPRRNGATLSTLSAADEIVAVCAATPVGVQRFARGLSDLRDIVPGTQIRVVVNRVRAAAIGAQPERQLRDALERYCAVTSAVFVPDDPAALDAAVLGGLTLHEVAPRSPARVALRELAATLADMPLARKGLPATARRRLRLGVG